MEYAAVFLLFAIAVYNAFCVFLKGHGFSRLCFTALLIMSLCLPTVDLYPLNICASALLLAFAGIVRAFSVKSADYFFCVCAVALVFIARINFEVYPFVFDIAIPLAAIVACAVILPSDSGVFAFSLGAVIADAYCVIADFQLAYSHDFFGNNVVWYAVFACFACFIAKKIKENFNAESGRFPVIKSVAR